MGDKQTEKSFASIKEREDENRMQSFHLNASGLDKFQYLQENWSYGDWPQLFRYENSKLLAIKNCKLFCLAALNFMTRLVGKKIGQIIVGKYTTAYFIF